MTEPAKTPEPHHHHLYLIDGSGEIVCPYCSRRYILTTGGEHAAGD